MSKSHPPKGKKTKTPGIYHSGHGTYEVRYREGTRQKSKTVDTMDEAISFKAGVRVAKNRGETIIRRKDVPTLAELAIEYMDRQEVLDKATRTLIFNAELLDGHILPFLGHYKTIDIDLAVLEAWQKEAKKGRRQKGQPELKKSSAYVLNRSRGLLGAIFKYGMSHGYMNGNPIEALEVLPHRTRRGQPATIEQIETMRMFFIQQDRFGYASLISLLAYGGLRPGEALANEWPDLIGRQLMIERHLSHGVIVPGTKTGGTRHPTLPSCALQDLLQWKMMSGRSDGLIYARKDGLPWTESDYRNWHRRWFKRAAAVAGLLTWDPEAGKNGKWVGDFRPYDLRHTNASQRIRAGEPVAEIANDLGHSLKTLFDHYAHEIEAMRGQPVVPLDTAVLEIRESLVGKKLKEKAV